MVPHLPVSREPPDRDSQGKVGFRVSGRTGLSSLLVGAAVSIGSSVSTVVTIDWVPIGNLRNSRQPLRAAALVAALLGAGCQGAPGWRVTSGEGLNASGLARAQKDIAQREYHASENGALQAPNRAHNLRTYFAKTGIRVHDRVAGGTPELLRLSLARVGRGESPGGGAARRSRGREREPDRDPSPWYCRAFGPTSKIAGCPRST